MLEERGHRCPVNCRPRRTSEQRICHGRLQSTIIRRIRVAGVQRPIQLLIFLYDNTQKEV